MHLCLLLWAASTCWALSTSSPYGRLGGVPRGHVLHERQHSNHVEGWSRVERAEADILLPMRIGLKQANMQEGHQLLVDISNPTSPNYGKHLSYNEVVKLFAPASTAVSAVREWLVSSGIKGDRISQSHNKQWIQFQATASDANKLLYADYHVYEHSESGVRNIATAEYHIPHTVKRHVDYITPGIRLLSEGFGRRARVGGKESRKRDPYEADIAHIEHDEPIQKADQPAPCNKEVTPACIQDQYGIPLGTKTTPGNELGIFQSLSQHYNQNDLNSYWQNYASYVPNGTHPELRAINGAYGPVEDLNGAGEEADLDLQVAIPLVWPQGTVLWQTDDGWYEVDQARAGTKYNGFFNTFFDAIDGSYCTLDVFGQAGNCKEAECQDPVYPNQAEGGYKGELMCGEYKPTNVIAISYSGVESVLPPSYMKRQCFEILKLGLQGVTVIESSGDHGVGGRTSDPRSGCLGPTRDVFTPRTMSNCPYVLSVGATTLGNGTAEDEEGDFAESAPTYFASGGGFSNVFDTPTWQQQHVAEYVQKANISTLGYVGGGGGGGANFSNIGVEKGKVFNRAGRGYPDVSAVGDNYRVYIRGYSDRLGGTSVAVPIWASVLTLINEERLEQNKSTVGFVHQVLYQHPEVFTDVTSGWNPGCGSRGFQATEGWDPVTGLGTPLYPKLLDLFMSLP